MSTSFRSPPAVLFLLIIALLGFGSGDAPPTSAVTSAPSAPLPPAPPPPPVSAPPGPPPGGIPEWAGQRPDEPFNVRKFLTSREAPLDNAADLYSKAFEEFDRTIPGPEPTAISREAGKFGDLEKLASGAYPADQIAAFLKSAQPVIAQIDAAQAKPNCVFVTGLGPDALLPHAQTARSLARLANIQLYHARNSGDFNLAEAAIKRGLRVSRDLQPRGPMVCQLVSMAIDAVVFAGIDRLTLNDPHLSVEQCDRILSILIEHQQQGLNRIEEGTCMEYLMQRTAIHDHQAGRLSIDQILDFIGAKSDEDKSLSGMPINHEVEVAACNRIFSVAIKESRNPDAQATSAAHREVEKIRADIHAKIAAKSKTELSQVPFLVQILAGPIDVNRHADLRARTNLAGLQMLVALKRYEISHGHLPANLEAAAAETALKSTPTDPYSRAKLKYAVISGKPTVYSVGKDLTDDGGKVDWNFGKQPGDYRFVLALRPETKLTPLPASAATSAPPTTKSQPALREWTSAVGSKIEAEFVRVENGIATLKKRDGSELRVPLDKLCEADQQWIRTARP